MTKQEQIEIFERAIPLINSGNSWPIMGVCRAIFESLPGFIGEDSYRQSVDWENDVNVFLLTCGTSLPRPIDGAYVWPTDTEGDEQRRAFLRSHIERLKKELQDESK